METLSVTLLLALIFCWTPILTKGREMCLSCTFNHSQGRECLNDPWMWPVADVRIKCPFRCFYEFWKDTEKEEYTYARRGCTGHWFIQQLGCYENEGIQYCYFSCDNSHYCNDWNVTDVVSSGLTSHLPLLVNLFLVLATTFCMTFVMA